MSYNDLIKSVKKKKAVKKKIKTITDTSSYNNTPPTCLSCGSTNIKFNRGKFLSKTKFRQEMLCCDCKCVWYAILNNSLKAERLEIEI